MNRKTSLNKAISSLLCASIMLTQGVFAYTAESNFWKTRSKNRVELAQIPQGHTSPFSLSQGVILRERSDRRILNEGILRFAQDDKVRAQGDNLTSGNDDLKTLSQSIPWDKAQVSRVYAGNIKAGPPLLLIQDIHLHPEAQRNVASILSSLSEKRALGGVAVESAFAPFDFGPVRSFSAETRQELADAYLEKNLISAPAYVGLALPSEPLPFFGVDNRDAYLRHVEALENSADQKPALRAWLSQEEKNLTVEKNRLTNGPLLRFLDLLAAYENGQITLGELAIALSQEDDSFDSQFDRFVEVVELEKNMPFAQVEVERAHALERLLPVLSEKEKKEFLEQTLAFRSGAVSFSNFYGSFSDLLKEKKISLRAYPAFRDYCQYVALSGEIDGPAFFLALEEKKERLLRRLIRDEGEKRLVQSIESLNLLKKLETFTLTPLDWEKLARLQRDGEPSAFPANRILQPFLSFYEEADRRSIDMVAALQSRQDASPIALIVGGFHAHKIERLLEKSERTFLSITPKFTFTEGEQGNEYLSYFSREKKPIDRLFEGKKLTVAPASVSSVFTGDLFSSSTQNKILTEGAARDFQRLGSQPLKKLMATQDGPQRVAIETIDGSFRAGVNLTGPTGESFYEPTPLGTSLLSVWVARLLSPFYFSLVGKVGAERFLLEILPLLSVFISVPFFSLATPFSLPTVFFSSWGSAMIIFLAGKVALALQRDGDPEPGLTPLDAQDDLWLASSRVAPPLEFILPLLSVLALQAAPLAFADSLTLKILVDTVLAATVLSLLHGPGWVEYNRESKTLQVAKTGLPIWASSLSALKKNFSLGLVLFFPFLTALSAAGQLGFGSPFLNWIVIPSSVFWGVFYHWYHNAKLTRLKKDLTARKAFPFVETVGVLLFQTLLWSIFNLPPPTAFLASLFPFLLMNLQTGFFIPDRRTGQFGLMKISSLPPMVTLTAISIWLGMKVIFVFPLSILPFLPGNQGLFQDAEIFVALSALFGVQLFAWEKFLPMLYSRSEEAVRRSEKNRKDFDLVTRKVAEAKKVFEFLRGAPTDIQPERTAIDSVLKYLQSNWLAGLLWLNEENSFKKFRIVQLYVPGLAARSTDEGPGIKDLNDKAGIPFNDALIAERNRLLPLALLTSFKETFGLDEFSGQKFIKRLYGSHKSGSFAINEALIDKATVGWNSKEREKAWAKALTDARLFIQQGLEDFINQNPDMVEKMAVFPSATVLNAPSTNDPKKISLKIPLYFGVSRPTTLKKARTSREETAETLFKIDMEAGASARWARYHYLFNKDPAGVAFYSGAALQENLKIINQIEDDLSSLQLVPNGSLNPKTRETARSGENKMPDVDRWIVMEGTFDLFTPWRGLRMKQAAIDLAYKTVDLQRLWALKKNQPDFALSPEEEETLRKETIYVLSRDQRQPTLSSALNAYQSIYEGSEPKALLFMDGVGVGKKIGEEAEGISSYIRNALLDSTPGALSELFLNRMLSMGDEAAGPFGEQLEKIQEELNSIPHPDLDPSSPIPAIVGGDEYAVILPISVLYDQKSDIRVNQVSRIFDALRLPPKKDEMGQEIPQGVPFRMASATSLEFHEKGRKNRDEQLALGLIVLAEQGFSGGKALEKSSVESSGGVLAARQKDHEKGGWIWSLFPLRFPGDQVSFIPFGNVSDEEQLFYAVQKLTEETDEEIQKNRPQVKSGASIPHLYFYLRSLAFRPLFPFSLIPEKLRKNIFSEKKTFLLWTPLMETLIFGGGSAAVGMGSQVITAPFYPIFLLGANTFLLVLYIYVHSFEKVPTIPWEAPVEATPWKFVYIALLHFSLGIGTGYFRINWVDPFWAPFFFLALLTIYILHIALMVMESENKTAPEIISLGEGQSIYSPITFNRQTRISIGPKNREFMVEIRKRREHDVLVLSFKPLKPSIKFLRRKIEFGPSFQGGKRGKQVFFLHKGETFTVGAAEENNLKIQKDKGQESIPSFLFGFHFDARGRLHVMDFYSPGKKPAWNAQYWLRNPVETRLSDFGVEPDPNSSLDKFFSWFLKAPELLEKKDAIDLKKIKGLFLNSPDAFSKLIDQIEEVPSHPPNTLSPLTTFWKSYLRSVFDDLQKNDKALETPQSKGSFKFLAFLLVSAFEAANIKPDLEAGLANQSEQTIDRLITFSEDVQFSGMSQISFWEKSDSEKREAQADLLIPLLSGEKMTLRVFYYPKLEKLKAFEFLDSKGEPLSATGRWVEKKEDTGETLFFPRYFGQDHSFPSHLTLKAYPDLKALIFEFQFRIYKETLDENIGQNVLEETFPLETFTLSLPDSFEDLDGPLQIHRLRTKADKGEKATIPLFTLLFEKVGLFIGKGQSALLKLSPIEAALLETRYAEKGILVYENASGLIEPFLFLGLPLILGADLTGLTISVISFIGLHIPFRNLFHERTGAKSSVLKSAQIGSLSWLAGALQISLTSLAFLPPILTVFLLIAGVSFVQLYSNRNAAPPPGPFRIQFRKEPVSMRALLDARGKGETLNELLQILISDSGTSLHVSQFGKNNAALPQTNFDKAQRTEAFARHILDIIEAQETIQPNPEALNDVKETGSHLIRKYSQRTGILIEPEGSILSVSTLKATMIESDLGRSPGYVFRILEGNNLAETISNQLKDRPLPKGRAQLRSLFVVPDDQVQELSRQFFEVGRTVILGQGEVKTIRDLEKRADELLEFDVTQLNAPARIIFPQSMGPQAIREFMGSEWKRKEIWRTLIAISDALNPILMEVKWNQLDSIDRLARLVLSQA